jgi:hypothetical protein
VNPLVDFALSADSRLSFDNAAVTAGVAPPPRGYHVSWARFDNATGAIAPLGETTIAGTERQVTPGPLPTIAGTFVRVEVSAIAPPHDTWTPVRAYFRRTAEGWTLVGLERHRA